ncbi:MAG TPA: hypothetical protein VIY52_31850 [Streptosporangiaceae bacterium]
MALEGGWLMAGVLLDRCDGLMPGAPGMPWSVRWTGVRSDHPLAGLIAAAAAGRYPAADGRWRRVPPWRPGIEAIVAFTGYAVLAVAPDIPDERLVLLGADGFGGAHDPRLTELSFELEPGHRGHGGGTGLVRDALTAIPAGQLVLAALAPGNAASVRALLSAGFIPLGSVQLFRRP